MVATLKTTVIQDPSSATANLTLDASGGVSVGQNLSVTGTTTFTGGSTFTGNATAAAFIPTGSSAPTNGLFLPAANSAGIATNSIERLRIDSSGNVIIGNGATSATPSNGVLEATDGSGTNIAGASLTFQGGRGTGTGAGGALIFQTAAAGSSGSALNAASERMRIDSSGNVGIGTNSPGYKLDISGGALGTTTGNQVLLQRLNTTTTNGDILEITKTRTSAGSDWQSAGYRLQQKVDATWMGYIQLNGDNNNGGISFGTGTSTTSAVSISERMRITANGGVSFGSSGTAYGTSGQVLQSNGDAAPSWTTISATGALIRAPQILTSGTSYTTPSNCTKIYVEAVGGGGGTPTLAAGASAGGNTTFTVGATTITAGGGATGTSMAGGTATNGDINIKGGGGGGGIGGGGNTCAGTGGSSVFGGGGNGNSGTAGAGVSGSAGGNYGGGAGGVNNSNGGGGGAYCAKYFTVTGSTAYTYAIGGGGGGGNGGGQGVIRIWEYT